jgi:hypothetical protein
MLLLVVCGTIADCDDYEGIAAWGEAHLGFLRRFLPYHYGVPGARWLTILMNRSRDAQADYLLAAKANQPTLRSEIEIFFADASPASLESTTDVDKGHGHRAANRHRRSPGRLARW